MQLLWKAQEGTLQDTQGQDSIVFQPCAFAAALCAIAPAALSRVEKSDVRRCRTQAFLAECLCGSDEAPAQSPQMQLRGQPSRPQASSGWKPVGDCAGSGRW